MIIRTISLLVHSLLLLPCHGQVTFENTYGSPETTEKGNSVFITEDQEYVITGSTAHFEGFSDVWIVGFNKNGTHSGPGLLPALSAI
jgi:hypothetical protein